MRQIEKHFGYVVTYEDMRYVNAEDIVDITEETRRDLTKNVRLFGRKNGSIDFSYTPGPGTVESQVGEVLAELISRVNETGQFGQFRADRAAGAYHVVPVAIRGKRGATESYASPLEARLSIAFDEANGLEAMLKLASTMTAASGYL